jgi:hypothetical protein
MTRAMLSGRNYVGLWRIYWQIMLTFGAVTGILCWPLGAVTVRLCWFLAQLLPHYFGLWRTYWEIMLTFRAVAARLC